MTWPRIGLTLDFELPEGVAPDAPEAAHRFRYAVSSRSVEALTDNGAEVVCLPWQPQAVARLLEGVDGVMLPGGPFLPRDPAGAIERAAVQPPTDPIWRRVVFEMLVAREAITRGLPILGICGGHQMINATLGGSFVVSLADEWPGALDHRDPEVRHRTCHSITLGPGSLLARLNNGARQAEVNSSHRQAVKDAGAGLDVIAHAPDGVVEAVERRDHPFCLGVQWHPEFRLTALDRAIMAAFVDAARARASARTT